MVQDQEINATFSRLVSPASQGINATHSRLVLSMSITNQGDLLIGIFTGQSGLDSPSVEIHFLGESGLYVKMTVTAS